MSFFKEYVIELQKVSKTQDFETNLAFFQNSTVEHVFAQKDEYEKLPIAVLTIILNAKFRNWHKLFLNEFTKNKITPEKYPNIFKAYTRYQNGVNLYEEYIKNPTTLFTVQ